MNSAKKPPDVRSLVIGILKGSLAGIVSGGVLMLIMAAIACATPDPGKLTSWMGYAALALATVVGGAFAVRFTGDGVLSGLLCGTAMSLMLWAVSLIPVGWESTLSAGVSALLHLIPCGAGVVGALIGKKRAPKRRRRRR